MMVGRNGDPMYPTSSQISEFVINFPTTRASYIHMGRNDDNDNRFTLRQTFWTNCNLRRSQEVPRIFEYNEEKQLPSRQFQ